MAITLAKRFIRQTSQPFDHSQTGISLWTLDDIEDRQRKDRLEEERAERELGRTAAPPPPITEMRNGGEQDEDEDMEFGIPDADLLENTAIAAGA